jgi:hypothetical protein
MFSKDDSNFYRSIKEIIRSPEGNTIFAKITRFYKDATQNYSPVEIGQKIIPLTVTQLENLDNIRYSTWLELQVAITITDLVINGISPNFPMFCNWFLIQNVDARIYDNAVMHFKLHNSEIAASAIKDLEQARKHTYLLDPIKNKEVYLSYNMEGLSRAVEIPLDYAEEEIVIASTALCTLTEHVGRTMADQPRLLKVPSIAIGTKDFLQEKIWYDKYLFEYLYGLYALNSRLGIIHGDLHLNNITLFMVRPTLELDGSYRVPNPSIIYRIHDICYMFPTTGRTSCIIDFSRCILNENSPILEGHLNKEIIIADQKNKILKLYERELPEFYKAYHRELQIALHEHYSQVFRMLTAIDVRKLCVGMLTILPPGSIPMREMTEKIRKLAEQYITVGMLKIFKADPAISEESSVWPVHDIITKHFSDYTIDKFPHKNNATLVDYFSIDNPLEYSSREYDRYPPIVKLDYIIKHKIPIDKIGIANFYKHQKKEIKEKKAIDEMQEREKASKSIRRGTSLISTHVSKAEQKEIQQEIAMSAEFYFDT